MSVIPPEQGLKRLWHHAGPHRGRVVLAAIYTTLGKVMDVMPEILIGAAIDVVVRGQDSFISNLFGVDDRWTQIVILVILNGFIWFFESLFGYLSAITWRNLSQTLEHEIRTELYQNVQRLDLAYFEDRSSGGLLAVMNDDINQLERFLDGGAASILNVFWNIVLVGAVFAASSWLITLLAFIPIPIIVAGSIAYQKMLLPRYRGVREAVAELSSTLSANLSGIATIKAFTAERREAERVERVSDDYRTANREAIRFSAAFVPLIRMAILAGFTCTLLVGGYMALRGDLEVGLYAVLVFMTQRLLWPMTGLGETLDQYQRAMAATGRIFRLMDERPTMAEGSEVLPLPARGEIRFDRVSFGYAEGPDILQDISIHVPAGETHAIVGATGAGKSTLLRLLLRSHDPRSGTVSIDGRDLKTLDSAGFRRAIGFVSQDVFLFHGTVRENIAFGRPEATPEEVEAAARAAEAHEFILNLPQGYETVVGERGQKLSGGQRQRLSLARSILRDPAILALDEATSAVDNETEAAIQRSLAVVTQDRTALVIAHRLSTVRDAHRIWVLEAGRVSEAGTHDELVAAGGLYAALWRVQTGERISIS
ncbi:MAG: ABC transporter ATP-binding protein/permease [Fimbriimonadaceae bacterium]|nr:ABC transporter ATP-binding protein/permease [Fimbriimonadaceae bacterium]